MAIDPMQHADKAHKDHLVVHAGAWAQGHSVPSPSVVVRIDLCIGRVLQLTRISRQKLTYSMVPWRFHQKPRGLISLNPALGMFTTQA